MAAQLEEDPALVLAWEKYMGFNYPPQEMNPNAKTCNEMTSLTPIFPTPG